MVTQPARAAWAFGFDLLVLVPASAGTATVNAAMVAGVARAQRIRRLDILGGLLLDHPGNGASDTGTHIQAEGRGAA
jgi:hypothetical protein